MMKCLTHGMSRAPRAVEGGAAAGAGRRAGAAAGAAAGQAARAQRLSGPCAAVTDVGRDTARPGHRTAAHSVTPKAIS